MQKISKFDGKFRFLSNFYESVFEYKGLLWKTAEHAYQAEKTNFIDLKEKIRMLPTASQAKKVGKKLPIREDWDQVKISVMEQIVYEKFKQNKKLMKMLIETDNALLEEGNYWNDTFWGICNGIGENHLGKILMKIREKLKSI